MFVTIESLLRQHFGKISLVAGAAIGALAFLREWLTIRKLRRELELMRKKEEETKSGLITCLSTEEVLRYTKPHPEHIICYCLPYRPRWPIRVGFVLAVVLAILVVWYVPWLSLFAILILFVAVSVKWLTRRVLHP